jgi:hypothetical protein
MISGTPVLIGSSGKHVVTPLYADRTGAVVAPFQAIVGGVFGGGFGGSAGG